ncbi:protein shisa-5-like isoform X2 [Scomber japonicus]|uniref:protein shisa-5-like isoform X2 n=1 Tax=Scomber japonicus TaxID=13676 RepID=UPI002305A36C|nr:protein shisa-5-like isoform X2 [Scomber japonicus]
MASGLPSVVVLVLCVVLAPSVSGDKDCDGYYDVSNVYQRPQKCSRGFCCGNCFHRYCCQDSFWRLSDSQLDNCDEFTTHNSTLSMVLGVTGFIIVLAISICCCVCPCCCLYKMCRKPRPVIATTTHTVVTTGPQNYPQQPMAPAGQPHNFQGAQYPPYHAVPAQPGYGSQPMPQGYGTHPAPSMPYQAQPFTPGPPPTYQEAIGPVYPTSPMSYSQAAFAPGQPPYPLQPPTQPTQPNAPPAQPDFLAQPAFNPNYVAPPPKTG